MAKTRDVLLHETMQARLEVLHALTPFYVAVDKPDAATRKTIAGLERKADTLADKAATLRAEFTVFDAERYFRLTRPRRVNEHATA